MRVPLKTAVASWAPSLNIIIIILLEQGILEKQDDIIGLVGMNREYKLKK